MNTNQGFEYDILPIQPDDFVILKRMQLGELINTELINEYSKVILAYVSLIVQNSHLTGMGDRLGEAGLGGGIEK